MQNEEKIVLEFEEDFIRGEIFSYADLPEKWQEGDYAAMLDYSDLVQCLEESASYVDQQIDDGDIPGMCGAYFKVYTRDEQAFRKELTRQLLLLLEREFGEPDEDEDEHE